jgi:hypothetical protein
MVVACAVPVLGARIDTVNDVTVRYNNNVYNNTSVYGLMAKNGGDRAYVEFTLDSTPATSATLSLYSAWYKSTAPVNYDIQITGGVASFNEDVASTAQALAALEPGWVNACSQFHVDNTPKWYNLDITSFYNSHLGQTVTLAIRPTGSSNTGDGPIFADHEGTPMGTGGSVFPGGPGYEPHIDWVPEPASLVFLGLGSLLARRRR